MKKLDSDSVKLAKLLTRRADKFKSLSSIRRREGLDNSQDALSAALADLSHSLRIAPDDQSIRVERVRLNLTMGQPQAALHDMEKLVADTPDSIRHLSLYGSILSSLERYQDAIAAFTKGVELSQSCAEASKIQTQVNEFRAENAPPPTAEEIRQLFENRSLVTREEPERIVKRLGFKCKPSGSNTFDDMVVMKSILLNQRGDAHRALGDFRAARRNYRFAYLLSGGLGNFALCDLDIEQEYHWSATEVCRQTFDFNTFLVLEDIDQVTRIAEFLLEDGDIKGACRLVFPVIPDRSRAAFYTDPGIVDLQTRVDSAIKAANLDKKKMGCVLLH